MVRRSRRKKIDTLTSSFNPVQTGILQHQGLSNGLTTLQRSVVNQTEASEIPSSVGEVLRGSGQPLDADSRAFMESRFHHDFSQVRTHTSFSSQPQPEMKIGSVADSYEQEADSVAQQVIQTSRSEQISDSASQRGNDFSQVRVHNDALAARSAEEINARAYTVKNHIVFGAGEYAPDTATGKELLAHELTHVLQQTDGFKSQPGSRGEYVQRKIGDGHDLTSPRFAGDPILEACYDGEQGKYLRNGSTGEAVKKVQQALVDAGYPLPKYGVDGIFGSETGAAVSKFKQDRGISPSDPVVGQKTIEALDQLFPGTQPPQPNPPQPNPPQPKPPQPSFNPQLEDTLDAVWLQYQIMLKNQNDALNRLEKDLTNLEKASDFNQDLMKKTISLVFGALFGAVGGSLRDLVQKAIAEVNMSADDQKTVVDKGVSPIFDEATKAGNDAAGKKVDEATAAPTKSLDTFIESQRAGVTEASDASQEKFLRQTKAEFRQFTSADLVAKPESGDPRLQRAEGLLKALKKEKLAAFDRQYQESLEKWATYQAQSKLGTKESKILSTDKEKVDGTDLSKGETGVSGVLEISIDGDTANKPVKIEGARIAGLSEIVRKKLEKQNPSIGGLGFPRLAMGKVNPGSIFGIKWFNAAIKIGENETGDVFDSGSSDGGKQWLKEKAAKAKAEVPDLINKVDEIEGARIVFNEEIDNKTLSQIPGGLKGP